MEYYQIIYIFPHPNDPLIFFAPKENISQGLYKEMCSGDTVPEALEKLSGLIYPVFEDGSFIMPDFKVAKIFTFTV